MNHLKSEVWEKERMAEREEKLTAQMEYCQRKKLPLFVDIEHQECWACGRKIYEGYNLEDCAKTHLTSCPFCNTSFTD